jgi:uncharacterized protein YkvS
VICINEPLESEMFKIGQLVEFRGVYGIVSALDGNYVQVMWETAVGNGVEFRTASAAQWRKFVKVEG